MCIKAVAFDIGQTLICYNNPLNWQALYPAALRQVMETCGLVYTKQAEELAAAILAKYNTRVNPREYEVTSDTIFFEILRAWQVGIASLQAAKTTFFSFFQSGAACFDDTVYVLQSLKASGVKMGALTDVAYGMDNEFALQDVVEIRKFLDVCLTSNDVGFRKPHSMGYNLLQKEFDMPANQIMFVGDEEKDIIGANNVGFISVLVNRTVQTKNFGQAFTVSNLRELLGTVASPLMTNVTGRNVQ